MPSEIATEVKAFRTRFCLLLCRMEMDFIKGQLGFAYMLPMHGAHGSGCINEGQGYSTDQGEIFVKSSQDHSDGQEMFAGELAGLQAIIATSTVRCPRPLTVAQHPDTGRAVLVMEFLQMRSLRARSAQLGRQLARLHLHNSTAKDAQSAEASHVGAPEKQMDSAVQQFGFHVPTCCGRIPQANTWHDDWLEFLTRVKLQPQIEMIERDYGDREVMELWSRLLRRLPEFFRNISVEPALLHGDLWSGNAAEVDQEPVVYDPASFYGHAEFDLGIAKWFGGFGADFYRAYHELLPRKAGFETRNKLYQLFHHLNHWNHFGSSYRGGSVSLMRSLVERK
ncbi:ketosamine-3-kinase-like isoform X2 [Pollicipes pollicipes]|uniref:ketosamine-3-kinase-like isoform X2 n=1 Tax=Pollicipes pollicipes TaxID=41117 RepID=UPI0018852880|nr:ketosamine-3-kinase-like isoform X2 [Pollicipes pollicipes]